MKYLVLDGDPEGELFTFEELEKAVVCYLDHPGAIFYQALARGPMAMLVDEYTRPKTQSKSPGHFQKY